MSSQIWTLTFDPQSGIEHVEPGFGAFVVLPGPAAPEDAATVALDLRTAVIGMLSLRINEPDLPWPPFHEQVNRFLYRLVGLAPLDRATPVAQEK